MTPIFTAVHYLFIDSEFTMKTKSRGKVCLHCLCCWIGFDKISAIFQVTLCFQSNKQIMFDRPHNKYANRFPKIKTLLV